MKIEVRVAAGKLRQAFAAFENDLKGQILLDGAQAGADMVAKEAIRIAPKDTRELEKSIHTEVAEVSPDSAAVKVVSRTDHSRYVEYGTTKMDAQPYLRPAFVAKQAATRRAIGRNVRAAIRARFGQ